MDTFRKEEEKVDNQEDGTKKVKRERGKPKDKKEE
jgi:hypothetical protein